MEQLIHDVWKHKMLPLTGLKTTDGQEVEVTVMQVPISSMRK